MTITEVAEKYHISQNTGSYKNRWRYTQLSVRDLKQVELEICMRNAGLPIEVMIAYVNLFQQGDTTKNKARFPFGKRALLRPDL